MSRAAVERHLGCAGRRVSRLRIGTQRRAVYTWYGRGTYGANLNVTFAAGRLADKSQLGLR